MEVMWLAGLLEGEGSFVKNKNSRGGFTPGVYLGTTDKDVAERAAHILTARVYGPYSHASKPKNKPIYCVHIHSRKAIGWMMTLYTLLGERRRSQVRRVLEMWKSRRSGPDRARAGWITRRRNLQFARG